MIRLAIASDDNMVKDGLEWLLNIAALEGIKLTLFCNSTLSLEGCRDSLRVGELIKGAYDLGHEIGNHGYAHSESVDLLDNILKGNDYLRSIGVDKVYGFRMPYVRYKDYEKIYSSVKMAGLGYDSSCLGIKSVLSKHPNGVVKVPLMHYQDGGGDIGSFDWNLVDSSSYSEPQITEIYKRTLDFYESTPGKFFIMNIHSGYFSTECEYHLKLRNSFVSFLEYIKSEKCVEFYTVKDLIDIIGVSR